MMLRVCVFDKWRVSPQDVDGDGDGGDDGDDGDEGQKDED
jgi:hypothetical protein